MHRPKLPTLAVKYATGQGTTVVKGPGTETGSLELGATSFPYHLKSLNSVHSRF